MYCKMKQWNKRFNAQIIKDEYCIKTFYRFLTNALLVYGMREVCLYTYTFTYLQIWHGSDSSWSMHNSFYYRWITDLYLKDHCLSLKGSPGCVWCLGPELDVFGIDETPDGTAWHFVLFPEAPIDAKDFGQCFAILLYLHFMMKCVTFILLSLCCTYLLCLMCGSTSVTGTNTWLRLSTSIYSRWQHNALTVIGSDLTHSGQIARDALCLVDQGCNVHGQWSHGHMTEWLWNDLG